MKQFVNTIFFTFLLLALPSILVAEEVIFYHTDNFGTPMAMTNATGAVVWRADELPFGEEYQTEEIPEQNNRRFLGKELDKETGLIYMGARYMDPKTGRFNRPDPVGLVDPTTGQVNQEMLVDPQRHNRYVYGLNNPYRYVDPDGEFAFAAVALFAAGAWAVDAMMPKSTNVSNSMGALDYMDNATLLAPVGAIKNMTNLPKAVNALKGMPLNEAKRLMSRWSKSTYNNISESIRDHASRHGFGDDIAKYLRKADAFNKKGAKKTVLSDGATRWNRENGEFLIERKGKTVTYGKNKEKD